MTDIILDQYTPGGVLKQLADAAGETIVYDQYAAGGPVEQLRVVVDPDLVLDQYADGGPIHQIELDIEGGGEYVAEAVHSDGTAIWSCASLSCVDSGPVSFVIWNKVTAADLQPNNGNIFYVSDPENSYVNWAGFFKDISGSGEAALKTVVIATPDSGSLLDTGDLPLPGNQWRCLIYTGNLNLNPKKAKLFLGETDTESQLASTGGAGVPVFNGLPFYLFGDSFGTPGLVGDFADIRIMIGQSLLDETGTIPLATIRLFVDENSKPVDPAVASATLGAPTVLFSGDATTFAANQGTGGAFTLTGSLTNASTSPSD